MSHKALFAVAAGLVFLCQLVAMALIVEWQVKQDSLREAQNSSAQRVMEECSENFSGATQNHCIEQLNAALNSYYPAADRLQAQTPPQGNAGPSPNSDQLMQIVFPKRQ